MGSNISDVAAGKNGAPPATNTLPSNNTVAVCCRRNCFIDWTRVKEPEGPVLPPEEAEQG
jgi:hypothetical protein